MHLIGWTVRGFDTGKRSPYEVAARIIKRIAPGAIVLLHEGHQTTNAPEHNPACIEQTLRGLAEARLQLRHSSVASAGDVRRWKVKR